MTDLLSSPAVAPGAALPEPIRARVEAALSAVYSGEVRVESVHPISQRASVSLRAGLSGPGPASVFVKHVPVATWPATDLAGEHVEFAHELLAQRFLEECPPPRPFRPRLLAWEADGFFVLEDLGDVQHAEMRTFGWVTRRLARALAAQHTATRGREARWLELRREMGLGGPEADRRRYGGPAQAWRFDEGRAFLARAARSRGVPPPDDGELDEARALVTACEGPLRAFLHEDLGNARQTFEVGDELFLLDYEYARWGPAPLDLCKAMLGKFELSLDDGVYLWSVPGFEPDLAAEYRAALAESGGPVVDDSTWDRSVALALAFHAVTLAGRLAHLEPDRRLVGTVPQNVNGILLRLHQLLPSGVLPGLAGFCERYLGNFDAAPRVFPGR